MQLTSSTKLDPPLLKVGIPELAVDGGTYRDTDYSRIVSSQILSGPSGDDNEESTSRGTSPEPIGNLVIDEQASDGSATPDESLHTYEERLLASEENPSLLRLPSTPLKFPSKSLDEHLDEKINKILTSLPSNVRLTAQNLKRLQNVTSTKRSLSIGKSIDSTSATHIPSPRSIVSNVSSGSSIPYSRGVRERTYSGQFNSSETKLYHLDRGEGQVPIKLLVRLVGSSGERVMVRIGGGWADLAEYLKEYALHHGSGRRAVSHTFEVQDLTNVASPTSKLPLPSTQNQRNVSGTGLRSRGSSMSGSRPASPMPPPQSLQVPTGPRGSTTPKTMRGGHNGGLSVHSAGQPTRPGSSLGGAMAKSIPTGPARPVSSLGTIPKAPPRQLPTSPEPVALGSTHPRPSLSGNTLKPVPTGPARPGSSLGGNTLKPVPTGPARPGSSLGGNTLKPVPTGPARPGSSFGGNTLKPVPTGPARLGPSFGGNTLKPVPTGPARPGSSFGGNTLKPAPARPGSSLAGPFPNATPTKPDRSRPSLGGSITKPGSTAPAHSESSLGDSPLKTTPKAPSGLMASKYADPPPSTKIEIPSGPRVPSTGPRTPTGTAPKMQEHTPSGPRNPSRPPSSQGYYNQNTPPQLRPPSSHRPTNSRPPSSGFDSPSRPGTRPASRLSFGASESLGPLGLAGPNSKAKEIAPEQQAWVDEEVRRVSAQRVPSGQISTLPSSAVGDEDEDEAVGNQQVQMHKNRFGGASSGGHSQGTVVQDMGKVGNTKRVYMKRSGFAGPGNNGGFSNQG